MTVFLVALFIAKKLEKLDGNNLPSESSSVQWLFNSHFIMSREAERYVVLPGGLAFMGAPAGHEFGTTKPIRKSAPKADHGS